MSRDSSGRDQITDGMSRQQRRRDGDVSGGGASGARGARVVPYDRLKRAVDVVLVLVGMVLLAPLFAVLAWRVRRELGSPVLFRQLRPGRDGGLFELRKFRTMTDERGPDGQLLPDEQRLTDFGRWLRSTSLDEIPEMVNVLRGEMSLVGPRPLLVTYLELYSPTQARRHEVRPGITGWSQINGRNNMTWDDKLALDVWYVDHRSLLLDVRILLRTLWVMVTRQGVSLDGHATTVPFQGSRTAAEGRGSASTEAGRGAAPPEPNAPERPAPRPAAPPEPNAPERPAPRPAAPPEEPERPAPRPAAPEPNAPERPAPRPAAPPEPNAPERPAPRPAAPPEPRAPERPATGDDRTNHDLVDSRPTPARPAGPIALEAGGQAAGDHRNRGRRPLSCGIALGRDKDGNGELSASQPAIRRDQRDGPLLRERDVEAVQHVHTRVQGECGTQVLGTGRDEVLLQGGGFLQQCPTQECRQIPLPGTAVELVLEGAR
jgi:sugar transferase EpsL